MFDSAHWLSCVDFNRALPAAADRAAVTAGCAAAALELPACGTASRRAVDADPDIDAAVAGAPLAAIAAEPLADCWPDAVAPALGGKVDRSGNALLGRLASDLGGTVPETAALFCPVLPAGVRLVAVVPVLSSRLAAAGPVVVAVAAPAVGAVAGPLVDPLAGLPVDPFVETPAGRLPSLHCRLTVPAGAADRWADSPTEAAWVRDSPLDVERWAAWSVPGSLAVVLPASDGGADRESAVRALAGEGSGAAEAGDPAFALGDDAAGVAAVAKGFATASRADARALVASRPEMMDPWTVAGVVLWIMAIAKPPMALMTMVAASAYQKGFRATNQRALGGSSSVRTSGVSRKRFEITLGAGWPSAATGLVPSGPLVDPSENVDISSSAPLGRGENSAAESGR